MANLETLELKISANAQEAAKGLGQLISSLTVLAQKIQSPLTALQSLNNELRTLKELSGRSFSAIVKSRDAGASISKVSDDVKKQTAEVEKNVAAWERAAQAKTTAESAMKETVPEGAFRVTGPGGIAMPKFDPSTGTYEMTDQIKAYNDAIISTQNAAMSAKKEIGDLMMKLGTRPDWSGLADGINQMQGIGAASKSAEESMSAFMQLMQGDSKIAQSVREANPELQEFCQQAMDAGTASGNLTTELSNVDGELKQKKGDAKQAAEGLKEFREESENTQSVMDGFKNLFKGLTSGITNFLSRIKRIAVTMAIRKAIRGLVTAMKEGVTNVYQWSKQMGGPFAQSMDEAKGKIQTLKNSLGAMLMPVIQALLPLFHSVTNAIIDAANWLNQFISLLTGKTSWVKATEQAGEYEQAAQGAAKANRDVLASWDELEVLQKDSGGGGAGGSQQGYENMFQEMNLFDEKIRNLVNWLNENLNSLIGIAAAIGTAFLAWQVSSAFSGIIGTIAGWVATGAIIALTAQVSWLLTNQYLQTGEDGWLIADILTTAIGATGAWAIARKLIGGQAGVWAFSITLAVSAIASIAALLQNTDVSTFSKESIATAIESSLMMGGAAGVLAYKVGGMTMLKAAGVGGAGALITLGAVVGLKASLDENIELFSLDYLATSIGSAAAVGLGIVMIGANPYVALGAAIVSLFAFVAIKIDTDIKKMQWGHLELSKEEVQEFVRNETFEPTAVVKIKQFEATIDEDNNLRESIGAKLVTVQADWNLLQLGVDKEATIQKIIDDIGTKGSGGLIDEVTKYCEFEISTLKLDFSSMTFYNGQGNPLTSETLLTGVAGWNNVSLAIQKDGQELTRLLFEGATRELTPQEEAYVQELMERITGWSARIANSEKFSKLNAEFKGNIMGQLSQGSYAAVMEEFESYSTQNEDIIRQSVLRQVASWYELADLTDDPVLAAKYRKIGDEVAEGMETTVQAELRKRNSPGRDMIIEWFWGENESGTIDRAKIEQAGEYWVDYWLTGVEGSMPTKFKNAMENILTDPNIANIQPEEYNMMNLVGFYGWDMLEENYKQELRETISIKPEDITAWRDELKINANELIDIVNWSELEGEKRAEMVRAFVAAYGSEETIQAIHDRLPQMTPSEIIKDVDWDSFSTEQKWKFLGAIEEAYGSEGVQEVVKNSGIDFGELVVEGMDSVDYDVKSTATRWSGYFSSEKPEMNVSILFDGDGPKDIAASLDGMKATMSVSAEWQKSGNQNSAQVLASDLKNYTGAIQANASWKTSGKKKAPETLAEQLSDYSGTIKAAVGWKTTKGGVSYPKYMAGKLGDYTGTMKTNLEWKKTGGKTYPKYMAGKLGDYTGTMKSAIEWAKNKGGKTALQSMLSEISGSSATITADTDVNQTSLNNTVKTIEGMTATITVSAKLASDAASGLKKAIESGIGSINLKVKKEQKYGGGEKWVLEPYAGGGLVDSGDIFVANENGKAEMIGRFGNQTAVANQEQMVEAMARGVQYANSEQNNLLREQNGLLRAILQKEASVKIGASSALGRTVKQSLAMYGAVTGG